MPSDLGFLALKCANCGGRLEVTPEMDRFSCGYCGVEQIVLRKGGTIALKRVEDAIAKVQVGTDKTAGELAISRLKEEIGAIREQERKSLPRVPSTALGCGTWFAFVGTCLLGALVAGWVDMVLKGNELVSGVAFFFVFGICVAIWALFRKSAILERESVEAEIRKIHSDANAKVSELEKEISKQKQIINS